MADERSPVNRTRLLESVIIAAITGAVSLAGSFFLTVPAMKAELDHVARRVEELRVDVNTLKAERVNAVRLEERLAGMEASITQNGRITNRRLELLEERVFNMRGGR